MYKNMFFIDHLDELDEKYKIAIKNLEDEIQKASNNIEKIKIFDAFSEKFMVVPEIWEYQIDMIGNIQNDSFQKQLAKYFIHFYSNKIYNKISYCDIEINPLQEKRLPFLKAFEYPYSHIIKFDDNEIMEELYGKNNIYNFIYPELALTFPHDRLEEINEKYREFSDRPIPKEILIKYQKAKKYFPQCLIENHNNNFNSWIEALFKWGDDKFAIQTIECKLAKCYHDKLLWKAYINAMRKKNIKVMLQIQFRYIRLFLNDEEMKENYEIEMKNAEKNYNNFQDLPNLFYYLLDENVYSKKIGSKCFENAVNFNKKNKNNCKPQYFSLPKTIMDYLLNYSTSEIRLKLFQSSKYFFSQKPTPICRNLQISFNFKKSKEFNFQSLKLKFDAAENFKTISHFYITNRLYLNHKNENLLLHSIIPKFYKCEAKFIEIFNQNLTLNDFEFLNGSTLMRKTKVEKFSFYDGVIKENEGTILYYEKLISMLPYVYDLRIIYDKNYLLPTPIIISTILREEMQEKIRFLHLGYFESIINIENFCSFLSRNLAFNAECHIAFSDNILDNYANNIEESLIDYFEKTWSEKAPDFGVSAGFKNIQ